jgi:polar amino acid transport system ATP-binding protein
MNPDLLRPPVLRAADVRKTLGGREILRGVSLQVRKGDLKVLIGPSGGGKSTLLQCLNCLILPDSGSIELEGRRINTREHASLHMLRQKVGMIFQDFNLFDHLSAEANVSIALRLVRKCSAREARDRAVRELEAVGLGRQAGLYPAQLSGGQKQRVAMARALAMDPAVLLLDEPTSALDPELVGEVLAVIRQLAAGGMTMIMATHQMDFARVLATEIMFIDQGLITEQGDPAALLDADTRTRDFCRGLFAARDAAGGGGAC